MRKNRNVKRDLKISQVWKMGEETVPVDNPQNYDLQRQIDLLSSIDG